MNIQGSLIGGQSCDWRLLDDSRLFQYLHGPLGKRVYVGAGAVVLCPVGDDAVVGAGSIVVSKVKAGTKVFGNPAKRVDW